MKAININNSDVEIGAEHIASRNLAIWGGSGILPVYNRLSASIINGEVVVQSGIYSNQGYEIEIPEGETESFTLKTESAGIKRYDLIISELSRDTDGVESHSIKLISGTAAISPTKPALIDGDFKGGDNLRQETIATILISGTTATVENMADILSIGIGSSANKGSTIYVQPTQPENMKPGDLWFW